MGMSVHCIEIIRRDHVTGYTVQQFLCIAQRGSPKGQNGVLTDKTSAGALNAWEIINTTKSSWIACYAGLFRAGFRRLLGCSPQIGNVVQSTPAITRRICSKIKYRYQKLIIAVHKQSYLFICYDYQSFFIIPLLFDAVALLPI